MPTIAEIADGVRLKAAHHLLEHRLRELRAARNGPNGFHARYAAMLASDMTEGQKLREAQKIQAEDADNNTKVREVRIELEPHREAHARRVAEALRDRRVDTANRIVSDIDDLLLAVAEWNEITAATRRWGADDPSIGNLLPALAPVRRRAAGEP